ncbi:MAG: hypothetical protein ABI896_06260 [Actinomycetota bacterium]
MHASKRLLLLAALVFGLVAFTTVAAADSISTITFEPDQFYVVGDINGQNGWMKAGPYDVAVAATARYNFGTQALRVSDAITSGSFGDQTFSPGLTSSAGEAGLKIFTSTFRIGTTQDELQPGLHMSVSPDSGDGGRMSYLRFEDQVDGIHVFFVDATNPGPLGHETSFNETDIVTLNRTSAHTITFSMSFRPGPGNDWVKVTIDGSTKIVGTTWEDYYRYDAEQGGNGNQIPLISKMLFRVSGTATPANLGNGFLVDGLSLSSSRNPGLSSGTSTRLPRHNQPA